MGNMLEISFIIVNWNAKNFLMNTIKSIKNDANGRSHEIIVVDNNSTDGSVKELKHRYPDVKIIENKKNFGFARANNIGISHSVGKIICLVNSDVLILEGCINLLYERIENDEKIGVIGPKVLNKDKSLQISCRKFPNLFNVFLSAIGIEKLLPIIFYYRPDNEKEVEILSGCFWMMHRKTIEAVGNLDEKFFIYAEDKDYCKRIKEKKLKIINYPLAEIIHYGGASSSNAPIKFHIEMYKANLIYWQKHYSRVEYIIYLGLIILRVTSRIIVGGVIKLIWPVKIKKENEKFSKNLALLKYLEFV